MNRYRVNVLVAAVVSVLHARFALFMVLKKASKWTCTQPLWFQTCPEGRAVLSAVYMRFLSLWDKWGNMQSLSCKHPVVDTELTASPKRLWLSSQWEYGPAPKQSGRERGLTERSAFLFLCLMYCVIFRGENYPAIQFYHKSWVMAW